MAEDGSSALGDFFAKKSKKKIKGLNLNVAPVAKAEETKKKKDADEQGWQEEEIVAPTLTVQAVGNLGRDEDKKDDEESSAPAWGSIKGKTSAVDDKQQQRFPTLAKSTRLNNTNIHIDDGEARVNIATNKNHFSALEGDDDDGPKGPKQIKPAMVTKAKGEFETTALKREVDKQTKAKKKKVKEDSDEESEEEEEEEDEAEEQARAPAPKKETKKKEKKVVQEEQSEKPKAVEEEDVAEDLKITPDDEEKAYTIEVDKSPGEVFLGITWKVTPTGFEIQSIDDEGLIAEWNEENDDKVEVYDLIVAVNDEGETDEMREELKKPQKMEIELVRASSIKSKYKGRRRLPPAKLPAEELKDQTKERPQASAKAAGGKKKKFTPFVEEDDKKKKLQYIEE